MTAQVSRSTTQISVTKKNVKTSAGPKEHKMGLHERVNESHIYAINKAFEEADWKRMCRKDFRKTLLEVAELSFEDDEYETLFLKINMARDGFVTWDEFISYLILGYQQQEIVPEYKTLDPPILGVPRQVKSNHRHPVNGITFYPTVKPDRSTTWKDGSIITFSKDGVINYWSLDLQLERTVQSTSPELKVQSTWVTDLCILPDVSVIVTSSTERDLRFYDTSARKFELRVMLTSLPYAVCSMYYVFEQDIQKESKLILGDMGGNVQVILFSSIGRGPFKSQPGSPLLQARYEVAQKGAFEGFRVVEFKRVHSDWVQQVSYYKTLECIVSCSACERTPVIMKDISETRINYVYKMPKGAWCFAFAEGVHLVATGGADCLVRVWNPFVPNRPTVTFVGHHAGVVGLILQDKGKTLASISKDRCIKIWDVNAQTCIQTYLGLPPELGERTDLTHLYNPESREIIVASFILTVVRLCPFQNAEHTDGSTHSAGVSVVLYNPLFKVVATCGLDSFIIIWDPWNGCRMHAIAQAHTRLLHGELQPVEITAATFDPGNQLLLTGAHDGTLKIWNFFNGTCIRNMRIENNCEVTSVIWIKGRILAIGWNRHVTEFNDSGAVAGPGGAFSKNWDTKHNEDILSTAVRVPQTLATGTFNGELILWQLETGQAYKQYDVSKPTARIKLEYKLSAKKKGSKIGKASDARPSAVEFARKHTKSLSVSSTKSDTPPSQGKSMTMAARARKVSMVYVPEVCPTTARGLAIHSMIFLSSRPMIPTEATLLVSIENGNIQAWSHHVGGGFITSFSAIHKAGDYVIAMETDKKNEFLFTGTSIGYIKIWLMKGFATAEEEKICMPKYRLMFPFLWRETFPGRAKRVVRGQAKPILLSCYKGHRMPIADLVYLEDAQILISCSADSSVRMWTIGGRYLQTIGTFKPWQNIEVDQPPGENFNYNFPPDIRRMASSTTFRVLNGGSIEKKLSKKKEMEQAEKEMQRESSYTEGVYGKALTEPILGNFFKVIEKKVGRHEFQLDTSFSYIPVYQYLIRPEQAEMYKLKKPNALEQLDAMKKKKETKSVVAKASKSSLRTMKNT